nr:hypothetical protein [Pseudomonas sp. BIGb0427]
MPGYIGTVHVDEGLVQSVSFEMGRTLAQTFAQTPSRRLHLHHLQALAAAFASSAKLRTLAATQASSFADVLRQESAWTRPWASTPPTPICWPLTTKACVRC